MTQVLRRLGQRPWISGPNNFCQIVIRSIFYYFSTGLYEYCLYYIPQLRFKNQQAIITESTNETAAPFIQFFFKEWIIIFNSMPCATYHMLHMICNILYPMHDS